MLLAQREVCGLLREEVRGGEPGGPIGPAVIRREGTKISCFAWGLMTHYCLQAAEELAQEGTSVEVVDLRCLAPLDRETILESARRTGKAMVVHEDNITGGFWRRDGGVVFGR